MRSKRQRLASRRNGAHSRGPVTAEGKKRASQNAISHGLLAKTAVLPDESRAAFEQTLAHYIQRFGPLDPIELACIEEMAAAYWRMRRSWSIENRLLSEGIDQQPAGDPKSRITDSFRQLASSPEFGLLGRYETRLQRIFQRALRKMSLRRTPGFPNEPEPTVDSMQMTDG